MSKFAIWIALVVLMLFFSVASSGFLTPTNLFNVLRQVAVNGIAAVGMTMIIITGGIDISTGSIMGVASVGCASLMAMGVSPIVAMVIVLVAGLLIGICNGFFVYEIELPPMIATLAVSTILEERLILFQEVCRCMVFRNPLILSDRDISVRFQFRLS